MKEKKKNLAKNVMYKFLIVEIIMIMILANEF